MTCIAGLAHENQVWIGGDSAGVGGYDLRVRRDTKVFNINRRFLIGYTSSFRMGQLLRFGFHPPYQADGEGDYEYMCTSFIDAVRTRLKGGGYATVKDNAESGGFFLVGYNGKLYDVQEDFQVGECLDGMDAAGCGESFALGSLLETRDIPDPRKRILRALKAAEYFSAGVQRPFVIRRLGEVKLLPKPPMERPVKKGK